jgi:hypothetical protein
MRPTVILDGVEYEKQRNGELIPIGDVDADQAFPALSALSAEVHVSPNGHSPLPELSDPVLAPDSIALHGIAGEVVRTFEPYTEADPAALLFNFHAEFGAMVGPMARARVGSAPQPPALFVALVGRSSRSRKGTATAEIGALMRQVEDGWHDRHQLSGFGSGEAFIEHASEQAGEAIYMVETELARVLAVASRDGSSVSSVLRAAWDFRRMEHRIRKNTYDAPPAPVVMVGHITIDELRDPRHGLRPVEIMNGFGNRVQWVWVDRRRLVPDPEPPPQHVLLPLIRRIRDVLDAARGGPSLLTRSDEARQLWDEDLYQRVAEDEGAGLVDALTARAEAQILRLSLLYALEDGAPVIDRVHLEAAWECWRYCRWSAQRIFVGRGTGDPDVDRIVAVLAAGEELTGRDLDRMFLGHRSTADLRERAIRLGVAQEISKPTAGRPAIVLTSPADKADKADKGLWWVRPTFQHMEEG